jgi:hypothetical protein
MVLIKLVAWLIVTSMTAFMSMIMFAYPENWNRNCTVATASASILYFCVLFHIVTFNFVGGIW